MNSLFHILCWESFHLKVHPTALPEREKTAVKPVSEAKNICRCLNIFLYTRNWQIPASCKLFWPPTIIIEIPANWCGSIHLFQDASDKWGLVPSLWQMTSLLLKGFLWEQCCRGHSMLQVIRLISLQSSPVCLGFLNWISEWLCNANSWLRVNPLTSQCLRADQAKLTFVLMGLYCHGTSVWVPDNSLQSNMGIFARISFLGKKHSLSLWHWILRPAPTLPGC